MGEFSPIMLPRTSKRKRTKVVNRPSRASDSTRSTSQPQPQPHLEPQPQTQPQPASSEPCVHLYDDSDDIAIELVTTKPVGKKRKRGPTCMPKVWGQPTDQRVPIKFNNLGQPNDERTCTLAHFLGTIARNGRFFPLHYKDWRLMPYSYKEEMLKIVKVKIELPPGNECYILKSINKKWKSWKNIVKNMKFDPMLPIHQQIKEIPERVEDEQYKSLIEDWMSAKTKAMSEKKKEARAQLELRHRMGKKKEEVQQISYKICYYRADCPRTSVVEQMKRLEEQQPTSLSENDCTHKSGDTFEKVMGPDKHGYVRMYGTGVGPADVYGKKPSRDASYRLAMEYKEKYEALSATIHRSAQVVSHTDGQTFSNNSWSSTSMLQSKRIESCLKSLEDINEIVAIGYISNMNSIRVNGEELGAGWCEVIIQSQMRKDVCFFKPYDHIQTLGESLGAPVAWPLSLVALEGIGD